MFFGIYVPELKEVGDHRKVCALHDVVKGSFGIKATSCCGTLSEFICLRDDASSVGLLSNLLQHLDQGVGDGHSCQLPRACGGDCKLTKVPSLTK